MITMAITPKEAREKGTPDPEVIKNLESRIDDAIIKARKQGETTRFFTPALYNSTLRETIIDRYTTAGWKVTYIAGENYDALQFTEKKPYHGSNKRR